MKRIVTLLLFLTLLSLGCKKSPRVKIKSPKTGDAFPVGQKIDVQVKQKNCQLLLFVAEGDTQRIEPLFDRVHFEFTPTETGDNFIEVFGLGIGSDWDGKYIEIF